MTTQLLVYGVLGVLSTAAAFYWNRHLFTGHRIGRISLLEGIYYFVAVSSLLLGWYFNIRYAHVRPCQLRQLHQVALHELGGRLGCPGLHDHERRSPATLDDLDGRRRDCRSPGSSSS